MDEFSIYFSTYPSLSSTYISFHLSSSPFYIFPAAAALVHTAHLSNKCAWCPHIFLSPHRAHPYSRTGLLRYSQNGPLIYLIGHTYLSIGYLFAHSTRSALRSPFSYTYFYPPALNTRDTRVRVERRRAEERRKKSMEENGFSSARLWLALVKWNDDSHLTISYPFWNLFSCCSCKILLLCFLQLSERRQKTITTFLCSDNIYENGKLSYANLNEHGHCVRGSEEFWRRQYGF